MRAYRFILFLAFAVAQLFFFSNNSAAQSINTSKLDDNPFAFRQSITAGDLSFRWDFEGGSLDSAALISAGDTLVFDIFSRKDPLNPADPKLAPSSRWYLFRMEGTKGKKIRLNIKRSECRRPFWSADGNSFERLETQEAPLGEGYIFLDCAERHPYDTIYIAYHNPYLASRLNSCIERWSKLPYVECSSIGKSMEGREMPILHITGNSAGELAESTPAWFSNTASSTTAAKSVTAASSTTTASSTTAAKSATASIGKSSNKFRVYIHGRIHTSESPASWHLEKLIDLITASTPQAAALRERVDFYILPFTNPDGVVNGLSRSGLHGINLEVNHADPDSLTCPEVKNIRAFLTSLTSDGKPVDLFLNMHSQIADYVTYWIHTRESSSRDAFFNLMKISDLTTSQNRLFSKREYSFSNMHSKYLEGWFWDNFGEQTTAITFETPYSFYGKKRPRRAEGSSTNGGSAAANVSNSAANGSAAATEGSGAVADTVWVSERGMEELAVNSFNAVCDFFGVESEERMTAEVKSGSGCKKSADKEYLYTGKGFAEVTRDGGKVSYRRPYLKSGEYDLYIWRCGTLDSAVEEENAFIKVDRVIQKRNGKFKYKYNSTKKGERLGSALLIPAAASK